MPVYVVPLSSGGKNASSQYGGSGGLASEIHGAPPPAAAPPPAVGRATGGGCGSHEARAVFRSMREWRIVRPATAAKPCGTLDWPDETGEALCGLWTGPTRLAS